MMVDMIITGGMEVVEGIVVVVEDRQDLGSMNMAIMRAYQTQSTIMKTDSPTTQ
jgi:hypothetical protein